MIRQQPPRWWRVASVGLGTGLGALTLIIAAVYLADDTRRQVWATPSAAREAFGIGVLVLYGLSLVVAALSPSRELRAGILMGGSLSIFVNGLFAGGNLDPIGGLLGLPALLGILAAAFALVESPRWGLAAAYWVICGAAGLGILRLSYGIADALGPLLPTG